VSDINSQAESLTANDEEDPETTAQTMLFDFDCSIDLAKKTIWMAWPH
jgi:hypothetical protein